MDLGPGAERGQIQTSDWCASGCETLGLGFMAAAKSPLGEGPLSQARPALPALPLFDYCYAHVGY
jgi:hypothetical protein